MRLCYNKSDMSKSRKQKKRKSSKKKLSPKRQARLFKKRLAKDVGEDFEFVYNPQGEVKMSDVLTAFVEPYAHLAENDKAYERLLSIGIIAWNMALHPEDVRREKIDEFLSQMMPADALADAKELVGALVKRKLAFFADIQRLIIDFEITDLGDRNHLSVVSTLPKQ